MNWENHIKYHREVINSYSICRCRDIWGGVMCYYGLYENSAYTEGFEMLEDLLEQYPELKKAVKQF